MRDLFILPGTQTGHLFNTIVTDRTVEPQIVVPSSLLCAPEPRRAQIRIRSLMDFLVFYNYI